MYDEPQDKRAIVFIDGSNIRHSARKAFGDSFANFNPLALARTLCAAHDWRLVGVHLYLAVPDVRVSEDAHYASIKRSARWRRQGVKVFTRAMQDDGNGGMRQKGIDVRLALDAVDLVRRNAFDIAVIMSQDQDFVELSNEIKSIAREQQRWVQVASAFPESAGNGKGIAGTLAVPIEEDLFAAALDTPENRRLEIALEPAVGTPSPETDIFAPSAIRPVFVPEVAVEPQALERVSFAPPRITPLWASLLAALYLVGAVATFGHMSWRDRDALLAAETTLPRLVADSAQAAVWPVYWLRTEEMGARVQRLVDRPLPWIGTNGDQPN